MFYKPLQTQLIQREWKSTLNTYHYHVKEEKKKSLTEKIKNKARNYLKLFLETSSIHGLNHLVAPGRHLLEKLFWLMVVALSVFGSVYLSRTTWLRYQNSPTVVSMDRDMYAWNTTFPSVTVCLEEKVDLDKLAMYLKTSNATDKVALEQFIRALSSATYETFDTIPEYDDIPPEDYLGLLVNLSATFTPTLTVGASGVTLEIVPTITEIGLCFAINSQVAIYNSPSYREANRWDIVKQTNSFFIHPLDGEVFAQVINIASGYNVYLHGPQEVPDLSTKSQHSERDYYMKIYVTAVSVYTTAEAAKLSVAQRRCRFPTDNDLKQNAIYTYTMCRMECRIQLCLNYCQCIPHFYRRIGNEKICDVKGLHCLNRYKELITTIRHERDRKSKCDCLPLCDDVNYVIQSNTLQKWFLGTNFQWGIITYPRMRYKRDVIFGFTDVLVAVGSMAGLFLGCSVLSFMEIIYFLTLRLYWYICKNTNK